MLYTLDDVGLETESEEWWVAPTAVLVGRVLDLPLASAGVRATVLPDDGVESDEANARLERAGAAVGVRLDTARINVRTPLRVALAESAEPIDVSWWAAQDEWWTDGSAAGSGRWPSCWVSAPGGRTAASRR